MPPVIRVKNLSKKYRLGVINRQMLVDQIEIWVMHSILDSAKPQRRLR
jgi:hypothetical protein